MLAKRLIRAAKAITKRARIIHPARRYAQYLRIVDGWAVTTDGNALVAEQTEDPDAWIDPQAVRLADAVVARNGSGCNVAQKRETTHHQDLSDTFPKWWKVMPEGFEHGDPAGYELVAEFDPEVLGNALMAFRKLEEKNQPTVQLWAKNGKDRGLSAVFLRQDKTVGLVMPCRPAK